MPPPLSATSERWRLAFSRPPITPSILPEGIERLYVDGPAGKLELLQCLPTGGAADKPPILFQHGGFGCAEMYLDFLRYFSARGYPSYALSVRNHGNSHRVGYFRMVFFTTPSTFAGDLVAVTRHVRSLHAGENRKGGGDIIAVGHSYGGGLMQYTISNGLEKYAALVTIGATPSFGGLGVYWNWFKMDPWFYLRVLKDWYHPRSPLSTTSLVHQAFFCPDFPKSRVRDFEPLMAEYESLGWPMAFMFRIVNMRRALPNLTAFGGGRVLIVAGALDRLMGVTLLGQTAEDYRQGRRKLVAEKKCEPVADEDIDWGQGEKRVATGGGGTEGVRDGVGFSVVEKSGHHLQNDLYWETCAANILDFLERIGA